MSQLFDLIVLGGGLRGCIVVLAMARWRPKQRVLLVDRAAHLGGGTILPFFSSEIDPSVRSIIDDVIVMWWDSYWLGGAAGSTQIVGGIAMITPDQLHAEVVNATRPDSILLGCEAERIDDRSVRLGDRIAHAGMVLDCRPRRAKLSKSHITLDSYLFITDMPFGFEHPILQDKRLATELELAAAQYIPLGTNMVSVRLINAGAGQHRNALAFSDATPIAHERLTLTSSAAGTDRDRLAGCMERDWLAPLDPLLPSQMASAGRLAMAVIELLPVVSDRAIATGPL